MMACLLVFTAMVILQLARADFFSIYGLLRTFLLLRLSAIISKSHPLFQVDSDSLQVFPENPDGIFVEKLFQYSWPVVVLWVLLDQLIQGEQIIL